MDPASKPNDVFVSYASADRTWVEGFLLDALSQAGVRYLSEASFQLGAPRLQEFSRAIQKSSYVLLVISPAYVSDDVSQFVELLAQSYGNETQTWPVIPLVRQEADLPPRLAMLVGLSATTPAEQEAAIERLCSDLRHPYHSNPEHPSCPYPGMLPYSEANHTQFFGRTRETRQMLERLHSHPCLTVIGPSGSGKSSLVFAGLLPQLRQSSLFVGINWKILTLRPGSKPMENLQSLLDLDPDQQEQSIQRLLPEQGPNGKLLLIVDQFEEVFTLAGDPEANFQHCLQSLLRVQALFLVITVRADFYADLMRSPLWNEIQASRLEITPLDETGLREAIERPAEKVGVFVEPALVERLIVDAAGEPGALPLVQETLVLMWDRIERRFLPLRAYEALVLPVGAYRTTQAAARCGLQVAIALRADACMASLRENPAEQHQIARSLLVRLVQFGDGRADTRRRQSEDDLASAAKDPHLFRATLDHLIGSRLLTSDVDLRNPGVRQIDIAHEALIACWPSLQQWINESRDAEVTRRRLVEKAKEWQRLGQRDGGLLDKVELGEAERWLSLIAASSSSADPIVMSFLNASRRNVSEQNQRKRMVIGGFACFGIVTAGIAGLLLVNRAQTNTFKNMLDFQLGNVTPQSYSLVKPVLATYLTNARQASIKAEAASSSNHQDAARAAQYDGIRNARAVLDIIFRAQTGNYNLKERKSLEADMTTKKQEAEAIMGKLIVPCSTRRIEERLRAGDLGELTSSNYLEYRTKYKGNSTLDPSALGATYEAIMIDLGADINRVGTLTLMEAMRIPCSLVLAIEKIWMRETDGRCSWYGPEERELGGPCIDQYPTSSLMSLVFPEISFPYVTRRLDQCNVHYSRRMTTLAPLPKPSHEN
jgi:hypothetical protein